MVIKNDDGTYSFRNGVKAIKVNGKYKIINNQEGGRVSMPSQYYGDINSIYSESAGVTKEVVNVNNTLPSGDLAREAIPSTFKGGNLGADAKVNVEADVEEGDVEFYSDSSSFNSNFDEQKEEKVEQKKENELHTGGESDESKLNYIYDVKNNQKYSIFSQKGKMLLKSYIRKF